MKGASGPCAQTHFSKGPDIEENPLNRPHVSTQTLESLETDAASNVLSLGALCTSYFVIKLISTERCQ